MRALRAPVCSVMGDGDFDSGRSESPRSEDVVVAVGGGNTKDEVDDECFTEALALSNGGVSARDLGREGESPELASPPFRNMSESSQPS